MGVCQYCGSQIPDGVKFCSSCGAAVPEQAHTTDPYASQPYQQPYQQPTYSAPAPQAVDSGSIGWAVLGFMIPIVGLVLFLVWKNTKPNSAKMAGMGALVSVILAFVFQILGAGAGAMAVL